MLWLATRWWVQLPLAIIIAGAVLVVYLRAGELRALGDPAAARREGRPIPVRTAVVEEQQIDSVIGSTCLTAPCEVGVVRVDFGRQRANDPAPDLVISAVHARPGDRVAAGQVLLEVDPQPFERIVEQHRTTVSSGETQLELRQEYATLVGATLQDAEEAYRQQAGSAVEVRELRNRLALARAEAAAAETELTEARLNLELSTRRLGQCIIRSPIAGVLTDPLSVPGAPASELSLSTRVAPGGVLADRSVLMYVLRLDPIHVVMDFPQDRLGQLRDGGVGQEAEVVLDPFPDEPLRGKIIRVLPQVDPKLRVLPVIIELPNPGDRIKAGVSGFVRLRSERRGTTVPISAIMRDGDAMYVFAVEEGRARTRQIRTGETVQPGLVEVVSGLAPGDELVVFHNFYRRAGELAGGGYLQNGDLVDANWRKWARRE